MRMFKETNETTDIYTFLESWPLEFEFKVLHRRSFVFIGVPVSRKGTCCRIIKVERKGERLPRAYIVNCLVSPTFSCIFFTFYLESGSDR